MLQHVVACCSWNKCSSSFFWHPAAQMPCQACQMHRMSDAQRAALLLEGSLAHHVAMPLWSNMWSLPGPPWVVSAEWNKLEKWYWHVIPLIWGYGWIWWPGMLHSSYLLSLVHHSYSPTGAQPTVLLFGGYRWTKYNGMFSISLHCKAPQGYCIQKQYILIYIYIYIIIYCRIMRWPCHSQVAQDRLPEWAPNTKFQLPRQDNIW